MLVVGTQSPAEIIRDEIAPAVIEQCGTQILAANPGADREHYVDGMKFEPEVFDVVKNLDPQARQYVVVKKSVQARRHPALCRPRDARSLRYRQIHPGHERQRR